MQKSIFFLTILSLTLIITTSAFALTPEEQAIQDKFASDRAAVDVLQEKIEKIRQKQASGTPTLLKESVQDRKAAFREKLKTIKDQKKQALVERIVNKITTFNTTQTTRLTNSLEKLTNIITSIEEKVGKAKTAGQDTAAAEAALAGAKTALSTAQVAVATQLAKDYTITINSESTLRNDVGTIMSQFRSDMQATHKAVVDAKQAVMQAAKELAKLKGTKTEPTVTP